MKVLISEHSILSSLLTYLGAYTTKDDHNHDGGYNGEYFSTAQASALTIVPLVIAVGAIISL